MAINFDKNIADNYSIKLKLYNSKILDKISLTEKEIKDADKIVSDYYDYLAKSGIKYGYAGKDVATNNGPFGRFANNYLEERSLAEGKNKQEIPKLKIHIKINLAYSDSIARTEKEARTDGIITYKTIASYHYNVFEKEGLSKYAWGGTVFEEFSGSGSWMDFGGYDTNVDIKQAKMLSSIYNNAEVNGVNARKAFGYMIDSISSQKSDTAIALTMRSITGIAETLRPFAEAHPSNFHNYKYYNYAVQKEDAKPSSFTNFYISPPIKTIKLGDGENLNPTFTNKITDSVNDFIQPRVYNPYNFNKEILNKFYDWKANGFLYSKPKYLEELAITQVKLNDLPHKFPKINFDSNFRYQNWKDESKYLQDVKYHQKAPTYSKMPDYYHVYTEHKYEPTNIWKYAHDNYHHDNSRHGSNSREGFGASVYQNSGGRNGFVFTFGFRLPLGIDLENDGLNIIELSNSSIFFDADNDGFKENIPWIGSSDSFLIYDHDQDNQVTNFDEISLISWAKNARSDLEALKLGFDSNGDGLFDEKDKEWDKFKSWQDRNQNAVVDFGEIQTLSEQGIIGIKLNYQLDFKKLGKTIIGATEIIWQNHEGGKLYDVGFKYSIAGIRYNEKQDEIEINYEDKRSVKIYTPSNPGDVSLDFAENKYEVAVCGDGNHTFKNDGNTGVIIDAGNGNHQINLKHGNNWVKVGKGLSKVITGDGHDIIFLIPNLEVNAGSGQDIGIINSKTGLKLNLLGFNIEIILGNIGNDEIIGIGKKEALYLDGGIGDDILIGGNAIDIAIGGPGKDKFSMGAGDDILIIDSEDEEIDGGEGNDSVFALSKEGIIIDLGKSNIERIYGTSQNDNLSNSGTKAVIIYGEAGDDILNSSGPGTILDGGSGNDKLISINGNHKYVFGIDYGFDSIWNKDKPSMPSTILLKQNIKFQNLIFSKHADDLVLNLYNNQADQLTLHDNFKSEDSKIKNFILNFELPENKRIYFTVIDNKDSEKGIKLADDQAWHICTLQGNDKVAGGNKGNWLNLGAGNDEGVGGDGDDFFVCGAGNDIFSGWKGNDTYYYQLGDGYDTIIDEYNYNKENEIVTDYDDRTETYVHRIVVFENAGNDKIVFGAGIAPHDLRFTKIDNNLEIIIIKEPANKKKQGLLLKNWFDINCKIEELVFENYITINLRNVELIGPKGNDIVYGHLFNFPLYNMTMIIQFINQTQLNEIYNKHFSLVAKIVDEYKGGKASSEKVEDLREKFLQTQITFKEKTNAEEVRTLISKLNIDYKQSRKTAIKQTNIPEGKLICYEAALADDNYYDALIDCYYDYLEQDPSGQTSQNHVNL